MEQYYKPPAQEFYRIKALPFYRQGKMVVHYEDTRRYNLDCSDETVLSWDEGFCRSSSTVEPTPDERVTSAQLR